MLRLRRKLPATTGSIKQLRSLAVAFALENCEPDDQLLADVALAVSEAATNVVHQDGTAVTMTFPCRQLNGLDD